ncbi:hypothetical protein [Streptomyces sp. NPDC046371]|uniref:hypothetical protein n=1 Tax=Streptomyces sp. NPDC046371 TaxID=3154916 RepID=UPI0033DF16B2
MTDDLTRGIITRSLAADHQRLLQDAQRIAAALSAYVTELERNHASVPLSGEAVRIGTYLIQHAQVAARYDGARGMARTLLAADDTPPPSPAHHPYTHADTDTPDDPPTVGFGVEVEGDAGWTQVTATFDTPTAAAQQRGRFKKKFPGLPTRIIRETVTRTIEPDTAGAES